MSPHSALIRTAFAILSASCALGELQPVLKQPSANLTVTLRFRDWSPVTAAAGSVIIGGNQTGTGGLFGIDAATGKLKWSFIPKFGSGTASVSTVPAVAGNLVITPFAAAHPGAVVAVAWATGREVWRGPDPAQGAEVAAAGDLAYIMGRNGTLHALEAATGRERWKVELASNLAPCYSRPIVSDGTIYFTAIANAESGHRAGYHLFALDAATGKERWRYRAEAPYIHSGVCLSQPVLANGTLFATGESRVYAVGADTGRDRWAPVEVRRLHDGRVREVKISNLVAAGPLVIGITPGHLIAFEQASGRMAWELPGAYQEAHASLAVAGSVLYFQGSPEAQPAPRPTGTLYALDLDARKILWSFTHPTEDPNWSFGRVTPVNGGLWVDTYRALLKLQ